MKHPEDLGEGPIEPPYFTLVCDHCGTEEPAPADAAVGEIIDCAYCGEPAEVEAL